MMQTAVAYGRYSSDNQREESITAQFRAIKKYCTEHDIQIIKFYQDEAKSATTDERPNFQLMISELKTLKPDIVLVHKLNRFARNRTDSAIYRLKIKRAGAKLVAVTQDFGDTPEAALMEAMVEAMDEYFSKNLAHEVRKGLFENAYKAQFNGGNINLGFDIDSDRHYVINEDEANIIRTIFSAVKAGKTIEDLRIELNESGYTNKRGRPFTHSQILDILKNEKYAGIYTFNKRYRNLAGKRNVKKPDNEVIRVRGALPAIISEEEFYEVQAILEGRRFNSHPSNSPYILSGIARCPDCGAPMVGYSQKQPLASGEVKQRRYYRCNVGKLRDGKCNNKKRIHAPQAETFVLAALAKRISNSANVDKLADKLLTKISKLAVSQDDNRPKLEQQIRRLENQIINYQTAIGKGADLDLIVPKLNETGEQIKNLQSKLAQLTSPIASFNKEEIKNLLTEYSKQVVDPTDIESCKRLVAVNIPKIVMYEQDDMSITFRTALDPFFFSINEPTKHAARLRKELCKLPLPDFTMHC